MAVYSSGDFGERTLSCSLRMVPIEAWACEASGRRGTTALGFSTLIST